MENVNYIDLYSCADEHNQQFIIYDNVLPEIISGSGGAPLDIQLEGVVPGTFFYRPGYGFVAMNISDNEIELEFHCQIVADEHGVDHVYLASDRQDVFSTLKYAIGMKR